MADNVAWELKLVLGDGGLEAFAALMESAGVPTVSERAVPGCYGWLPGPDKRTAQIVLGHDGPLAAATCWAGDWTTAERHLAAIASGLSRRLLAVAQPIDLVSFGACEGDLPANTVPRPSRRAGATTRPDRTARRRDVVVATEALRSQTATKQPAAPKSVAPQ